LYHARPLIPAPSGRLHAVSMGGTVQREPVPNAEEGPKACGLRPFCLRDGSLGPGGDAIVARSGAPQESPSPHRDEPGRTRIRAMFLDRKTPQTAYEDRLPMKRWGQVEHTGPT